MMADQRNKKILFIPLSVGLAHTGRLIVLAKELENRGYEIVFGVSKQVAEVLDTEKIRYHIIPELPKTNIQKIRRLDANSYTTKNINNFVKAELQLYEKENPAAVVSDTRATVRLSAKIAGIPHITLNNANITKYYDYRYARFPLPTFFLSEFLPARVFSPLERDWMQKNVLSRVGPTIVEAFLIRQLLKFNIELQRFGQRPTRSLYNLYRGDISLICDVPFYRPTKKLPKDVVVVGPIFWQPSIPLPEWASEIEEKAGKGHKIIYATAGGTGEAKVFKKVLEILSNFPAVTVATTGNAMRLKEAEAYKNHNMYITNYLPGDWIMSHADALIFFGGNATAYQALANGLPQISMPLHLDQQDNANQLNRLGTTIILNPYRVESETLLPALSDILYKEKFKNAALKYKEELKNWHGPVKAADEIERFLRFA